MIFGRGRGNSTLGQIILGLCLALPVLRAADAVPAASAPGFASFVCWDYSKLPQLKAWKETGRIIGLALAEGYPGLRKLPQQENGTPDQLKDFLRKLPDASDQINVVYLAAHQSPGGEWYFPDRSVADWGALTADLPKLKSPQRIVLLDCCYAESASHWPGWTQKVAPACLYASPANRPTPDLLVFWRRPVDWATRFPGAAFWLRQHHVDNSDERISYFGLVWLEAWAKQPTHPRTMAEWNQMAQTMTQIAQHASTQISANSVSDITSVFPR